MTTLKAKLNDGAVEVALADIMVDDTKSVVDVAQHWAIFLEQYLMALDITKNGLQYPIIVKKDDDTLRFAASGARIQYAVISGYTHIDAVLFDNDQDILAEMERQRELKKQILDATKAEVAALKGA